MKQETKPFSLSGRGKVYGFSTLNADQLPEEFKSQAPLTVGIVELEEGMRVSAQFTDFPKKQILAWVTDYNGEQVQRLVFAPDLEINQPVEHVTRKLHDGDGDKDFIRYGYKFRPVIETSR